MWMWDILGSIRRIVTVMVLGIQMSTHFSNSWFITFRLKAIIGLDLLVEIRTLALQTFFEKYQYVCLCNECLTRADRCTVQYNPIYMITSV